MSEPSQAALDSSGPPWIFAQRGAALEAPENTLASFERALELGVDGLVYEARIAAGGEVVVFADTTLERTTDGFGLLAEASLPHLASLDAGGWFDARFRGERVPLLEEVLSLAPNSLERGPPQHVIVVPERADLDRVRDVAREFARRASIRIASSSREGCVETRALGSEPLWLVDELSERERDTVETERFTAIGAPIERLRANSLVFGAERFGFDAWAPDELFWAARSPIHALVTHEPERALAARRLARLARADVSAWPVRAPSLEVEPGSAGALRGDWSGAWDGVVEVANPFGFEATVTCSIRPRRGAFEIGPPPPPFVLAPAAIRGVPFALVGGSWRVGGDPAFVVRYSWRAGPGRRAGALELDTPLARVRTARADALATRLVLLRNGPTDPPATLTLRRHRRWLFVSIESPGGLEGARTLVSLAGREHLGSRGVRVPLPADFDTRAEPLPFSCGLVAWQRGERVVRRFAGGLGPELDRGAPGFLIRATHGT